MNKTNLGYLSLLNIFLIIVAIIFLIKMIINNKCQRSRNILEKFEDKTFEKLIEGNVLQQRNKNKRKELILEKADTSIKKTQNEQGKLRFENADINSKLMDEYIHNMMMDDVGNPNKTLVEDAATELPSVIEDNLPQYNHEMRKIRNSKKLKQEYLISILRYKIETLLNSLQNIEDIKDNLDNLKLPINAAKLEILKKA